MGICKRKIAGKRIIGKNLQRVYLHKKKRGEDGEKKKGGKRVWKDLGYKVVASGTGCQKDEELSQVEWRSKSQTLGSDLWRKEGKLQKNKKGRLGTRQKKPVD